MSTSTSDLVADLHDCEEKALRGRVTRDDAHAPPDLRKIAALQASCYGMLAAITRQRIADARRRPSRP